ncbi:MFS transporter [Sphingobacterium sp. MYb382]|uniref:MFS transporter n=1 Tax=Sphingobacterium sp. MYb382 TaxID=2745278 RepID=UPI0030B0FEA8
MKRYAYIGSLGFLGIITTEFGVIGILPELATYYGISLEKAGVLLSAFALVIALTGPAMTLLTAKFDRKKIMLLSLFTFLITGVVSTLSPPFWLLLLVRVLPAFLQPVYIASALTVAVSRGNKSNENELMSIVFSGVTLAMVTTVPFATYIASMYTWQYSFAIQGLISFIALAAVYFGLPSLPVTERKSFGSQLGILKKPIFVVSILMNFFMISAWFSVYSYFAAYLSDAKGMNQQMVSYMMFVFGLVGVFSTILSGKMLNKHIPRTSFLFLLGTILVPILLGISGGNNAVTIFVIAVWGFLYAPSFLNASTYMISAVPHAMEFANSLATSFGNLGVSVGTTVGGMVIAHYGIAYTPWLTLAFGLLALVMMALRHLLEKKKVAVAPVACSFE